MPSFIQPSFAAGELAPSLYARVDLAKFHIGAQLLRNFFVLPHGGASNRAGTMFVGRALNSAYNVQLIPFQFNLVQTYMLEFGHQYMRVIMNGGYVLETPVATTAGNTTTCSGIPITGITNANPGVVTVNYGAANYPTPAAYGPFKNGDQVFIAGTGTQLDSTPGRQYLVQNATSTTFTLTDLDGNVVNTTSYGSFAAGATVARVFTLVTPYQGGDIQSLKWTQSNDTLTLCHPSYPPQDLTRTEHWVWTLTAISFAPTVQPPAGVAVSIGSDASSSSPTSGWNYAYVVTAVTESPPDESLASAMATGTGSQLNSNTGCYNSLSWTRLTGASYYRIYKANPLENQAQPSKPMFGYIGTSQVNSFIDTEIGPDFTQAPPQGTNPFIEGPITEVSVKSGGAGYPANLKLSVSDISGTGAVLTPTMVSDGHGAYKVASVAVTNGGQGYQNPTVYGAVKGAGAAGFLSVEKIFGSGPTIIYATVTAGGQNYDGNQLTITAASGGSGCVFTPTITNGVITGITVTGTPVGYNDGDALVFTVLGAGAGNATFNVTVTPGGNYPGCASYFQQRKCFASSSVNPQTLWMTKPGDFKNMDVTNPSESSDSITATIAATQVNAIAWMVPMNNLVVLTQSGSWLIVGGTPAQPQAVTPINCVLVPQTFVGCSPNVPPIVVNYDILYVQSKGSIVRDLAYNFWANIYTGTDMSILSNHLFFGHNIMRWCYAEQPFYQVWAVRDDGILLSFTYLKEQDVYAWAHHDSFGNSGSDTFVSVASIPEQQVSGINIDSVYVVVQRTIPGVNGGLPVKYIERMDGRNFLTSGVSDVTKGWFVDCGLQYYGTATATITGLDHLNGCTVAILADGSVQPSQVVQSGSITLPAPASRVTVGLPYVSQLQTLPLTPTQLAEEVQSFRKKISAVMLKVTDTRGLQVGPNFNTLNEMKERTASASMGSAIPLAEAEERIQISNQYAVDDCVCIQQSYPLPCTILGVIPDISVGD